MRRVYGVALFVLALAAYGCASEPAEGGTPPSAALDGPQAGSISAAALFSPGPSEGLADVYDPETGERLGVQTSAATAIDDDGSWMTETVLEGEPPRRAGYVRQGDGAVALAWSRSVKDTDPDGPARLYVFDPPLVMAPAVLGAGEVFEAESRMTERDPRDESRVVLSGRASRRLWLEAPGEGAFAAVERGLVAAGEMVISVGPAEATRKTWTLITAGEGREEVVDYSIRVLGLRFKHERTRLVPRGGDEGEPERPSAK